MNEELLSLGMLTQEDVAKQTVEKPACHKYFMHGLGHPLGLDVHDVGFLTEPFGPGWVLTVEPGVYIPAEGFGVRLENDILVTDQGPVDLHGSDSNRSRRDRADHECASQSIGTGRPVAGRQSAERRVPNCCRVHAKTFPTDRAGTGMTSTTRPRLNALAVAVATGGVAALLFCAPGTLSADLMIRPSGEHGVRLTLVHGRLAVAG